MTARRPASLCWILAAWLACLVVPASAQGSYPTRPITRVLPCTVGSASDNLARTVGDVLGRALGQPVIVDSRPGAGGMAGTTAVARAAPDGYTLLLSASGTMAVNPHAYAKLPYRPRSPNLPEVPAAAEAGLPGFVAVGGFGLAAPRGTPPAVVDAIGHALQSGFARPEVRQRLQGAGWTPVFSSPKEPQRASRPILRPWERRPGESI